MSKFSSYLSVLCALYIFLLYKRQRVNFASCKRHMCKIWQHSLCICNIMIDIAYEKNAARMSYRQETMKKQKKGHILCFECTKRLLLFACLTGHRTLHRAVLPQCNGTGRSAPPTSDFVLVIVRTDLKKMIAC